MIRFSFQGLFYIRLALKFEAWRTKFLDLGFQKLDLGFKGTNLEGFLGLAASLFGDRYLHKANTQVPVRNGSSSSGQPARHAQLRGEKIIRPRAPVRLRAASADIAAAQEIRYPTTHDNVHELGEFSVRLS